MASFAFTSGQYQLHLGNLVFSTATIKIALIGAMPAPIINFRNETFLDGIGTSTFDADYELTNTGYAPGFAGAGRKTLAGKSVFLDNTNFRTLFQATNPAAWTLAVGSTVYGAVIYWHNATGDDTSYPLWYIECADTPTNGGTFTFQFNAAGIGAITHV